MDSILFVNPLIKSYINSAFIDMFPNLNATDKHILISYTSALIEYMAFYFRYDDHKREMYEQLKSNNFRDIKSVILLLLPFINEKSNFRNITSIQEVYTTNNNSTYNLTYTYTNYIYGARDPNNFKFINTMLKDNFILLLRTIEKVANKLYINWIDVVPLDAIKSLEFSNEVYDKWKNKKILYNEHTTKFNDPNLYVLQYIKNNNNRSIQLSEIYDYSSCVIYESIKDIKWLIFDIFPTSYDLPPIPYMKILGNLFNVKPIVDNEPWNELDAEFIDIFSNKWTDVVKSLIDNTKRLHDHFIILSHDDLKYYEPATILKIQTDKNNIAFTRKEELKFIRGILYYFIKRYKKLDQAIEDGMRIHPDLLNKSANDDEAEDDELGYESFEEMLDECSKTLPPKHFYEFIRISVLELKRLHVFNDDIFSENNPLHVHFMKQPAFFSIIIDPNATAYIKQIEIIRPSTDTKINFFVSLKMFYNFIKSFVHKTKTTGKFVRLPKRWDGLSNDYKNIINNRLYDEANNDPDINDKWFVINQTFRRYFPEMETDRELMNAFIDDIYKVCHNIFIYAIVYQYVWSGTLSRYIPNQIIHNFNPYDTTERKKYLKKYFLHSDKFDSSLYFINNKPFNKQDKITIKINKDYDSYTFFENIIENEWTIMYAMNWMSQISFFHRFMNNRILYVTGGTGVGKSTQVPKLLLYGLYAFDYKLGGKIACSQPRIKPTTGNAQTIASQMGVPILDITEFIQNTAYSGEKTDNYSIQYAHQKDTHKGTAPTVSLEIMTDGLLYQKVKNPILKSKKDTGNIKELRYTDRNIYDIIVVDESHEHNPNMDMILTLMKYGIQYNNTIRLVIISATMDDDEATYRRYYKTINDNYMYPINYELFNNKISRFFVDRRIHIEEPISLFKPKQPTRYEITEIIDTKTEIIDIIKNIVNTSNSGHLLVFMPGQADIIDLTIKLNQILPENILAVEFFSKMNSDRLSIVENINDKIGELTIPRTEAFYEYIDGTSLNEVAPGTYNRAIIVATNIAEASITISNLKYVIDNGTSNVMIYDYTVNRSHLYKLPITISSREQRKGRVGRTSPGTVYYTYDITKQNTMPNLYKISIGNVANILYDVLNEYPNSKPLFTKDNDPYINTNQFIYGLEDDVKSFAHNYQFNLGSYIQAQYYNDDVLLDMGYDPYIAPNSLYDLYSHGFDIKTVVDINGTFYIVHPDETNLVRDIDGKFFAFKKYDANYNIVDYIKLKNNVYYSNKISAFLEMLQQKLYIVNYNKTEYSKAIEYITRVFSLPPEASIMLLYSHKFEVLDDMLKLLSIYYYNPENVTQLNELLSRPININKIRGLLQGNDDNDVLLMVFNKLLKEIDFDSSIYSDITYIKDEFVKIKDEFFNIYYIDDPIDRRIKLNASNVSMKLYNKLLSLYRNSYINRTNYDIDNEINAAINSHIIATKQTDKIKHNELIKINDLCIRYGFNINNIIRCINSYATLLNSVLDLQRNKLENAIIKYDLDWSSNLGISINPEIVNTEKLKIISTIAMPYNVMIYVDDKQYTPFAYIDDNNVYTILSTRKEEPIIFIDKFKFKLIMAINKNDLFETISILNQLQEDYLSYVPNVFNSLLESSLNAKKEIKLNSIINDALNIIQKKYNSSQWLSLAKSESSDIKSILDTYTANIPQLDLRVLTGGRHREQQFVRTKQKKKIYYLIKQ